MHSVRVAANLPFTPAEVAPYLFDEHVVPQWLGEGAVLRPEFGAAASLPQAPPHLGRGGFQASLRTGYVEALSWPPRDAPCDTPAARGEIVVALDAAAATPSRVAFRLAPRMGGGCRLRIAQDGLAGAAERHAAVRTWQAVLDAAAQRLAAVRRQQRRERQAVVVIHGIGEQRPGQLLREFVANVFPDKEREVRFVKPDRLSSLFEMRMVTVPRSDEGRPTTDVYELYWAHLIRDTTAAQVYRWIWGLLWSKDASIPAGLRRAVRGLRLGVVLALVALLGWAVADGSTWLQRLGLGLGLGLAALPALPWLLKKLGSGLINAYVVGYAGDAARYLEPRAGNVARRQEIREAGVELIDQLHDQRRYARIVVYGHSLGSVIAYDILSHAWIRRARRRDGVRTTRSTALRRVEDLLNPRPPLAPVIDVDVIQALQHDAWREYQRNGFQWRVSDLVTAGSPLAHASWLLNLDERTDFAELKGDRSLPTCPPQTETANGPKGKGTRQAFTFTHAYPDPRRPTSTRSVQVPHHAALFAITRWTNLYFPVRGLRHGDVIAGPLQPAFGEWIKDVRLREATGFAHTRYTDGATEPKAVAQVRDALHLPLRRPLAEYADADG